MRKLMTLLFVLSLAGCAAAPKPVGHGFSTQQKWQAAQHWNVLAADLAKDVSSLAAGNDLAGKAVYVKTSADSPFDRTFSSLLITELVNNGVTVAYEEKANPVLDWSLIKVRHLAERPSLTPFPGQATAFALLGAGVYKLWDHENGAGAAALTGVAADAALQSLAAAGVKTSHTELVVTATLWIDGDMLLRKSNFYYINDIDKKHYDERPDYWEEPVTAPQTRYNVVDTY